MFLQLQCQITLGILYRYGDIEHKYGDMRFGPHRLALVWTLELSSLHTTLAHVLVVKRKRLCSLSDTFQTVNYLQLLSDPGPTPERLPEDVGPFETDSSSLFGIWVPGAWMGPRGPANMTTAMRTSHCSSHKPD